MLGMSEETGGGTWCIDLARGETLLLYTDGLYSLRSKSGERFTHEIVEQTLLAVPLGADGIADLVSRIASESDGTPTDDDLTVIALRRCG